VLLTGDTTEITALAERPASRFVFANAGDFGCALVLPDSSSVQWLETGIGTVSDDLQRAML